MYDTQNTSSYHIKPTQVNCEQKALEANVFYDSGLWVLRDEHFPPSPAVIVLQELRSIFSQLNPSARRQC